MQTLRERVLCDSEQIRAAYSAELVGYLRSAAERVFRRLGMLITQAAWKSVGHPVAVDGDTDTAEEGDAEGAAELGAGLGDAGRDTGPVRRDGADDQVGSQRDRRDDPERDDDR